MNLRFIEITQAIDKIFLKIRDIKQLRVDSSII